MSMICEKYLNSVVSIGIHDSNNTLIWIGTGFFVYKSINEEGTQGIPFLVTNKHVVNGLNQIYIKMKNLKTSKFEEQILYLENNVSLFFDEDPNVDLAIIKLDGNFINQNNLKFDGFDIYKEAFATDELIKDGANQGNLIYTLGFPLSLVNINQTPLCRLGCLSRMDLDELNERKAILCDIQNFPGQSGSPVIIRPDIVGIVDTKVFNQSVLIGVIKGYIPYQEKLVSTQTNRLIEIREENSGIAEVIPVEFIRKIINRIS